ncbi:activating signal cointegrator complex subunit 3 [Pancytospora epiphaga]|nr:activating signal cointegrator complex subunit 3 [Pancytospora epiphaga]
MKTENLVEKVGKILKLPYEEAHRMIKSSFDEEDPQNILLDVMGYENVDLVFSLVQNRSFFEEREIKNDELKYVEHIVPSEGTVSVNEADLIPTADTGKDARFFKYKRFNAVQSQVYSSAYHSDDNLLVCAPTGAGKTDIALLTILRVLKDPKAKIIYVVPMKALASEITRKYSEVFFKTGINVIEYTGDTEIESEVAKQANIIVCTPEKFDVSTRRHASIFSNIRLFISDEIHLLGDSRGPVLEILVARMFRMSELNQKIIRIVGLSATLPNYRDVARFIRAPAVFYFGSMYRPVPLEITVTGFKKGSRITDEEDYLIRKISRLRSNNHQILVFVHSRARTVKVAKMIVSRLSEDTVEGKKNIKDENGGKMKKKGNRLETGFTGTIDFLVQHKIGIHHAGLHRPERLTMERYFKEGKIDVLVCTSTLAWGVNLPAHAVIIYGTSFYNHDIGTFDDVGILDVIQIFGRAGRPQYDTTGEAVLITSANKVDRYLSLLKGNKDVESSLLHHVTDAISAEIYLSNIFSVSTALLWIKSTFLYVRMMRSPALYGLDVSESTMACLRGDSLSYSTSGPDEHALTDYILLALKRLESCGLIRINRRREDNHNTWIFESTTFGRIASFYYLNHLTMHLWLENLGKFIVDGASTLLLLLRSEEFKDITLRDDEMSILEEIHTRLLKSREIDVDFEATLECKLIILISAYFAYIRPPLFSLICDMDFIVENLQRMLSALKEILLYLKRYDGYKTVLALERRIWRICVVDGLDGTVKAHYCGNFIDLSVSNLGNRLNENVSTLNCSILSKNIKDTGVFNDNRSRKNGSKGNKASKHISMNSAKSSFGLNSSVLLYKNFELIYAGEFRKYFRDFVFCPEGVDSIEVYSHGCYLSMPLCLQVGTSMADLYYYGAHFCDTVFTLAGVPPNCPHFLSVYAGDRRDNGTVKCSETDESGEYRKNGDKYKNSSTILRLDKHSYKTSYKNRVETFSKLNIQFITISVPSTRERLKIIDSKIYKITGSVLVVCSDSSEVVANELNTRLALDGNFNDLFGCSSLENTPVVGRRWIAGLRESRSICDQFEWVIFRGCFLGRSYYPIYEIYEICNGRKAIIYECESFIEYLKSIISNKSMF